MTTNTLDILGVNVNRMTYDSFLNYFDIEIKNNGHKIIAYVNAHTSNLLYSDENLKKVYGRFDIIHPDGIGVYFASKILYGNDGLKSRFTGSDFYNILIKASLEKKYSYFFFGHDNKTLSLVKKNNPLLNIKGMNEGYNFNSEEVLKKINESKAEILIIGLKSPFQEKWIVENRDKIHSAVILAVGEGIKVFAGIKIRGPEIVRKLGFEWFVRFLSNPFANFRKYIIGNPLFIFRVLKQRKNMTK